MTSACARFIAASRSENCEGTLVSCGDHNTMTWCRIHKRSVNGNDDDTYIQMKSGEAGKSSLLSLHLKERVFV
jgi:hypothetical protein